MLSRFNCGATRSWRWTVVAVSVSAYLATALPTLLAKPLAAQQTGDEGQLAERWQNLSEEEAEKIAAHHLRVLALATHAYGDEHNNQLPPPVVPNPNLPPDKRLSGLVFLLPYFGKRPSYYAEPDNPHWLKQRLDPEQAEAARKLYESIDLTKAWDAPVNLKAAKTIVPAFLVPGEGPFCDAQGYAVSHFAFVRGYGGRDDGAFPEKGNVYFFDPERKKDYIADGTAKTLGIGQIHTQLGPWIAAGVSTARHRYHPDETTRAATFGSRYGNACYFARCDGSLTFVDLHGSTRIGLHAFVTRAGNDGQRMGEGNVKMYKTIEKWKQASQPRDR